MLVWFKSFVLATFKILWSSFLYCFVFCITLHCISFIVLHCIFGTLVFIINLHKYGFILALYQMCFCDLLSVLNTHYSDLKNKNIKSSDSNSFKKKFLHLSLYFVMIFFHLVVVYFVYSMRLDLVNFLVKLMSEEKFKIQIITTSIILIIIIIRYIYYYDLVGVWSYLKQLNQTKSDQKDNFKQVIQKPSSTDSRLVLFLKDMICIFMIHRWIIPHISFKSFSGILIHLLILSLWKKKKLNKQISY